MKTASEVLRAARKTIEKPEQWTKGAFGRDHAGHPTNPPTPTYLLHAACRCINGALFAAVSGVDDGTLMHSRAGLIMSQCARRRGYETASRFNDAPETTHADVLSLFDEAIAWAESDA